ncbi:MAG: hypothetical protein QOG04_486 [Actinomycetota bacterium]|jgi:hypothetical protein|nr:hypothetical protein [Actinomycetota bacterium]
MKRLAIALSAALIVGLLGSANAAPSKLWEDPTGDADNAQGLGMSIPAGFDLVSGSIERAGANLNFTVTMADMPPSGSIPDGARFLWAFAVNSKTTYRLTAKSADIGKPDALAGNGTERVGKVDAQGHFRLEGNCQAGETVGVLQPINCETLGYITGAFDTAAKTLTITVPMKLIKAKIGTVIGPGSGDATAICAASACWVSHVAERSHSDTLIDVAFQTASYKIK